MNHGVQGSPGRAQKSSAVSAQAKTNEWRRHTAVRGKLWSAMVTTEKTVAVQIKWQKMKFSVHVNIDAPPEQLKSKVQTT